MTVGRILLPLVLLAATLGGRDGVGADPMPGSAPIRETGSYVRRYWAWPIYEVTLETLEPRLVASSWRARSLQLGRLPEDPDWARLATFLTEPRSRVPVRLTVRILTGLKSYAVESRTIRELMGRVGLLLDENWTLLLYQGAGNPGPGGPGLQREVRRMAEMLFGLSADRPGPWYRSRKKGDAFVLRLEGDGKASVAYRPGPQNTAARPGEVEFADGRVVAALVQAFLLPGPEEEGADPAALLHGIREACASRSAALR